MEGKKRRLFFKEIRMADAGNYTCHTNADETKSEVTVECNVYNSYLKVKLYLNEYFVNDSDVNKFNKKLKDTNATERQKLVLEVEVADQTAAADFFLNGEPIKPSDRVEIKNLGGGKHQLIFNSVELSDQGEIKCKSGKLKSTCQLTVNKGESIPNINLDGPVEGPTGKMLVVDVPYLGKYADVKLFGAFLRSLTTHSSMFDAVDGVRQSPVEAKLVKDGKAFGVKDVEIVVMDDKVVMKMKKTARSMSGNYQIKLSNAQGEATKDVFFNIQGTY